MPTRRTPRLLALTVTGVLALVACGGSDSASPDTIESDTAACEAAQKVAAAFDDGVVAESAEEITSALGAFAASIEAFAEVAPDEIKDAADLLADGTRRLADVPVGDEPGDEVTALLTDESYDAAGNEVDEYFDETCGLQL